MFIEQRRRLNDVHQNAFGLYFGIFQRFPWKDFTNRSSVFSRNPWLVEARASFLTDDRCVKYKSYVCKNASEVTGISGPWTVCNPLIHHASRPYHSLYHRMTAHSAFHYTCQSCQSKLPVSLTKKTTPVRNFSSQEKEKEKNVSLLEY